VLCKSAPFEALFVIYIFVFAPPDSNRLALKARVIIGGSQRLQQVLSQSMGPGDGLRKVKLDHQHDQKATNKPVLCQNWIYMHIICMYIIIHIHMHIMHIYICVCVCILRFPCEQIAPCDATNLASCLQVSQAPSCVRYFFSTLGAEGVGIAPAGASVSKSTWKIN